MAFTVWLCEMFLEKRKILIVNFRNKSWFVLDWKVHFKCEGQVWDTER